jgi:hypothetical protein
VCLTAGSGRKFVDMLSLPCPGHLRCAKLLLIAASEGWGLEWTSRQSAVNGMGGERGLWVQVRTAEWDEWEDIHLI